MGTDIHVHMEVRLDPDGPWHHYGMYNPRRNYYLFGELAGVRSDDPPRFEVKGMPEDASVITQFDCDRCGVDGHTHSWLSWDELREFIEGHRGRYFWFENWLAGEWAASLDYACVFLFGNGFAGESEEDHEHPIADLRMVFWFDC